MAVQPGTVHQIRCKTCDVGTLEHKKKYRLSRIVVAIGYILLMPSVLGMGFSILMLIGTAGAAATDTVGAGAAIVGGVSVFFFIMSLVGGVFGYLLVMKKRVLQCNTCGAVIAAS